MWYYLYERRARPDAKSAIFFTLIASVAAFGAYKQQGIVESDCRMADLSRKNLDALLKRAGAGDAAAFRRFYDLTAPAILAFLLKMLPDRHAAEDVLQESMVVAWNRASDFDPQLAAAKTWITTIARRRAIDVIRRSSRRSEVLNDAAADIRLVLGKDGGATNDAESSATSQRLEHCLGELGDGAAISIQYAYVYGLTFSEIANQIDRSLGTIKSWVRRGLQKLKTCMER